MTKTEARLKYKALRKGLSAKDIETQSIAIANQCLALPIWSKSTFHLFLSISTLKEIDTQPLMTILMAKDKNIIISKTDFENHQMHHYFFDEHTILKNNAYNIPEPTNGKMVEEKEIDVVFVPLLAFDKKGNRVGYGKGFYDGFLSKCNDDVIKIGLSFFEAEDEISPIDHNDIPLDYCVTPQQIYTFEKK